jgi:hydrophobic/amphiphilic exporter-1 (mainly G- bacteria), HAE1 family
MRIIDVATERRVTVLMVTLAVVLFGFVSLARLKVNLLPDLAYPTLTVRTELPGAAPLEVENLLTKPIEEVVGVIKNVKRVRSISRSGQSDVILEFAWGTDMDVAGVDVREKADLLELPREAERPVLLRFDPSTDPIMRLALRDKSQDSLGQERLKWLRTFAEERLKTDLEAVEGTAAIKISGGLEDEIQITVDEDRLAALNLSIDDVVTRLRAENVNLSGGELEQGSQRFLVRTLNEFTSVDQIAEAIIASPDGRPIYLKDVATVSRSHKERQAVIRVDGREAVELSVYKEGDGNTVQTAARIKQRLDVSRESLPDSVELSEVYDQSHFISSAIDEVLIAGVWGGLLAVLLIYAFLRDARATFIIGITIPVCVIGTFVSMYASDLTLNIMSLGGIALAVGMVVDDAIVVLESIVQKKERGAGILEAARTGTSQVVGAVTASTLTSVAVFFPMVFVSGIAGQLFRDQALTVTYALLLSLVAAFTLIPMLAGFGAQTGVHGAAPAATRPSGRFTRGVARALRVGLFGFGGGGRGLRLLLHPIVWPVHTGYERLARLYPTVLVWSLRHKALVLGVATAMFLGSLALVPRLGKELIPQLAQGELNLALRLRPGMPLEETDRVVQATQQAAGALSEVALTYGVAGTGNRLDANPIDAGENVGQLYLKLQPGSGRVEEQATIAALRTHLADQPGVEHEFSRPALFSARTPLEVELRGYDLDRLGQGAEQLRGALAQSPRFADVRSSMQVGNPEIQIVFDHERAAKLGLAVRDIADEVVSKVRGDVATRYTVRDRKIDVLVRSVDPRSSSIEDVRGLIINPESSRPITLAAVADVRVASGPNEIRRADQERVAIISANLAFGDLGAAVGEVDRIIAATALPVGITAAVSGQNTEMQESFGSMRFALILAIFLVYLVMAAQFESLIHPFVIMFTVPLAAIGAILALYVTGTTLNVVAFIGMIVLAGIVVKNAIVLLDLVNQLRAQGVDRDTAIIEAGRLRLRPIILTALTAIVGVAPMALGIGEGAEVRQPMAITIIGGLAVSTLLTLVVIPVVYTIFDRSPARAHAPAPAGAQPEAAA